MAKQLNVDMRFTADTAKAKQSINELQQAIQKLGYGTVGNKSIVNAAEFEKASAAARELAYHLNNAYNAKTGNLDLSKLNASLKQSGTDLGKLTANFKDAGATGQQAFVSLAKAIATADQPTISLNTHLATMWTTLKNVARFQISSSIMHGLIGGVQTAYGYAQDLNESLNNIRIVTGQSADQMAKFAKQANTTARNLNSTTLDYTNASLIYYQQGLSDSEVQERTNVTLKMANVARESAETVSEQMTAIWNNFDDGSKSLEYYADVITALGAATASSSSEISAGLNKFAAVADTVGLSYENATAALATITATTRQSADTVGTGLRTLFSRLQGLSLGETLEDGVDLNKYSKALKTVGVDALDAEGNLRRMDDVLEDLGERWGDLSKAQQTALAQTVGGVRQYTTLVALMDNWDFMKSNQQVAAGAEGTLQKQADIYAESWEAARDRVKTAAESIYDTLIDENFFIGVDKVVEHVLTGVNKFLESFGGIKSALTAVLSFVLSMTANKIGPAVQKVVQDIKIMTGGASKVYAEMQGKMQGIIQNEAQSGKYSLVQQAQLQNDNNLLIANTKYNRAKESMSDTEQMYAELAISGFRKQAEAIEELAIAEMNAKDVAVQATQAKIEAQQQYQEALQATSTQIEKNYSSEALFEKGLNFKNRDGDYTFSTYSAIENLQNLADEGTKIGQQIQQNIVNGIRSQKESLSLEDIFGDTSNFIAELNNLKNIDGNVLKLDEAKASIEILTDKVKGLKEFVPGLGSSLALALRAENATDLRAAIDKIIISLKQANISSKDFLTVLKMTGADAKLISNLQAAMNQNAAATNNAQSAQERYREAIETSKAAQERFNQAINQFSPGHVMTGIEGITATAAGIGSLVTVINSLKSAFTTLSDSSATAGQKLVAVLMAISMGVSAGISSYTNFRKAIQGVQGAIWSFIATQKLEKDVIVANTIAKRMAAQEDTKLAAQAAARYLVSKGIISATMKETVALALENAAKAKGSALSAKEIIQTVLVTVAKGREAGTHIKNAFAMATEAAAAMGLEGALAPILIIVVALAAAISAVIGVGYGLVTLFKGIYANANKDEIALKNMADASKRLKEEADNAKSKLSEVQSAFDGYEEVVEKLNSCTKGTQEWNAALAEVNQLVLDIISNYPELAGIMKITRGENGELKIENTEEILENLSTQANALTAAKIMTDVGSQAKHSENSWNDFEERYNHSYDTDSQIIDGFFVNGEDAATIHNNARQYDAMMNQATKVFQNVDYYSSLQTFDEFLTALGYTTSELSSTNLDILKNFFLEFSDLTSRSTVAQEAMRAGSRSVIDTVVGPEFDIATREALADSYYSNYSNIYDEVLGLSDTYSKGDTISDLDSNRDSIWHRYLRAIGEEETGNLKLDSNAIRGYDYEREYYFSRNGEEDHISAETMAATIAAAESLKQLGTSAENVSTILNSIDDYIPEGQDHTYTADDIKNFIAAKNFEQSSVAAFQDMFNEVDLTSVPEADVTKFIEYQYGDLVKKIISASGLTEGTEEFNKAYQDYIDNWTKAAIDYATAINDVGRNLSETPKKAFETFVKDSEGFKDLTVGEQSLMTDMLQQVFNALGPEELERFAESFGSFDSTQMQNFTKIFSDFDFSTGNVEDLYTALNEVGITADMINLQPFIDYMLEANAIASTFDNATAVFKGIQDIINGIATGDTITDENYDALSEKYNISTSLLDSYFITMADGTHKLAGSAEEFQAAIKGATLKNFETNISQAQADNDRIRSLQNSGYSLEDLSNAATTRREGIANHDLLAAQLNVLQNTGYASQGQEQANNLAEWQNHKGDWNTSDLQAIADAVSQVSENYENLDEVIAANEATIIQNQAAMATTASTLQELSMLGEQYNLGNEALEVGLQNLGTMYDNASQELEAYRRALASGNEEAINAAQANLEAAIKAGEAAAEYGLDVDILEDLTDTFAEYNDKLSEGEGMLESDAEAAKDAAVRYMRLNNAVDDLADNYDTYETAIKNVQKAESKESKLLATNNKDYAAFKSTMADLLDTSEDLIDLDFVDSMNLDDLKKAAEGDEEAIGRLRDAFIEATAAANGIDGSKILDELSGFEEGQAFTIDLDNMPFLTALIQARLAAGDTAPQIQEMLSGFGIDADVEPFKGSMAEMAAAAADAADGVIVAMDAAAGSGLDANVNTVTAASTDTKEDVEVEEQITWEPKPSTGDKVVKDGDDEATPVEQQLSQARKVINWNPVSTTETTEQTAAAVEIKNAHKSSGGHTGGSSKKTGGGGGGGGSKSKKKDAAKADAGTRYHTVRAQQSRNSSKQSNTNRKKERAFGTERVKLIEKEVELQKEQLKLQETYLTEIKNNLKTDKKDLTDALNALGLYDKNGKLTIEFDTDGIIKNYQRIEDALLARENELIDQYNARQDDAKDEWFDDEKEKLDELRDLLSQYEETQGLYLDELDNMQEYIDNIADSLLELTEYKVELNLDVANDDLERIQFLLDQIDNNAYKAAEAISLFGEQTANSLDQIDIYQKGIEEILGHHGLSLTDLDNKSPEDLMKAGLTADEISQIRDWRSAIVETNTELLGMRETIVDKVVDSFTELNDKVAESYDLFDHYNTVLENYKNITDLMGRHMNIQQKELLRSLDNAMLKNATNTVTAAKVTFDTLTEARKEAQRAYDQAVASGDEAAMLQWQKVIDETDAALNEAQEEWLDAWQNAIEMVQDIFETAIDDTIAKFEESITGAFGSLDYMQEAYGRARDVDEEYLQDYDRLYELSKLQRDLNKVLNDTKGVANRKELLALQKELNQLQAEGTRLSQYDVDALRMKFELQQAYADLQGVGQAKNTVRLQRDHNGNWGYVYTADEDKVAEAEQEYEDKLHAYQQLNDEYINELQERALDIQSTYAETLRDIMTDTSLTKEQREARINELNSWFESEMAYIEQQSGNALGNQAALNERYLKAYNDTRAQMVDEWSETTLSFLEGTEQMDEYINKVMEAQQALLKEAMDQLDERDKQIEKITEQAGTTVEALGDTIGKAVEDIGNKSDKTTEQVQELSKELLTEFKDALGAAVDWEKEYQNRINKATDANNDFVVSINKMISALSELSALDKDDEIKMKNYYHELQERMELLQSAYSKWSVGEGTWDELEKAQKNFFKLVDKQKDSIDNDVIQKFDTGGYTGEWGSGGKLAFLHEKEEIFNKHDTANLLSAAQILRTLDLQAFAMNFSMLSTPTVDNNNQVIEQDVHITAEFPNATNHTEIEEAFTNLANKAAQYANRKNG